MNARSMIRSAVSALCAWCVLWSGAAGAGSTPPGQSERHDPVAIAAFAKEVEKAVAERGARVFLLARMGRAPSELAPGIRYTHVAFGVYSRITTTDGRELPGYAIYNLYQRTDDAGRSQLVQDYPVNFFSDVHELEAGIIIPVPELQAQLLEVIGSERYRRLHNPRYSVIANPFDRQFQNCTEFVLDVINAAIYGTDDPAQIKANLRAYFEPQLVELSPLKLAFGSMLLPGVKTVDHEGPIKTATFESIVAYMVRHGLAQETFILRPLVATALR